jgi:hypothetical protein
VLAVGLKQLEHAALGERRVVHQLEQRKIAQLGTAVKVALRKNIAILHHDI